MFERLLPLTPPGTRRRSLERDFPTPRTPAGEGSALAGFTRHRATPDLHSAPDADRFTRSSTDIETSFVFRSIAVRADREARNRLHPKHGLRQTAVRYVGECNA